MKKLILVLVGLVLMVPGAMAHHDEADCTAQEVPSKTGNPAYQCESSPEEMGEQLEAQGRDVEQCLERVVMKLEEKYCTDAESGVMLYHTTCHGLWFEQWVAAQAGANWILLACDPTYNIYDYPWDEL